MCVCLCALLKERAARSRVGLISFVQRGGPHHICKCAIFQCSKHSKSELRSNPPFCKTMDTGIWCFVEVGRLWASVAHHARSAQSVQSIPLCAAHAPCRPSFFNFAARCCWPAGAYRGLGRRRSIFCGGFFCVRNFTFEGIECARGLLQGCGGQECCSS